MGDEGLDRPGQSLKVVASHNHMTLPQPKSESSVTYLVWLVSISILLSDGTNPLYRMITACLGLECLDPKFTRLAVSSRQLAMQLLQRENPASAEKSKRTVWRDSSRIG